VTGTAQPKPNVRKTLDITHPPNIAARIVCPHHNGSPHAKQPSVCHHESAHSVMAPLHLSSAGPLVLQQLDVQISLGRPCGHGDMAKPGGGEIERRLPVRECADHPGAPPDLPQDVLKRVVGARPSPMCALAKKRSPSAYATIRRCAGSSAQLLAVQLRRARWAVSERIKYAIRLPANQVGSATCSSVRSGDLRTRCVGSMPISPVGREAGPSRAG